MEKIDKKIYRSNDNYLLAGVCSGLSTYFGIDTTLIRLTFVLLALWGGSGILIYLILWLLVPAEPGVKKEIRREGLTFFLGVVILLVGATALWNRFFPIEIRWDVLWPVMAILLGILLIFKK